MMTRRNQKNKKILSWWWKYWINSFLVPDPPTSPQLISDPTSTSVFSGERVKLTCVSGRGNPLPKLTWMRDGNPLRQETGNYNLVSTVCKLLFTSEKNWRRVKSPQIKLFKAPTTAFFYQCYCFNIRTLTSGAKWAQLQKQAIRCKRLPVKCRKNDNVHCSGLKSTFYMH